MIVRYGIANITAKELAEAGQAAQLEGSVSDGFGFGQWGVEPTAFLEIAAREYELDSIDCFVRSLLQIKNEGSAYRTIDGHSATLLHSDGLLTPLTKE